MTRLPLACFLLLTACAAQSPEPGHIRIIETSEIRRVPLANETTVAMRLGRVAFADGVEGLLVDYVTIHPLGSAEVAAEIPYVWWAAMPSARQFAYTQGWVRALQHMSGTANQAEAYRACLTAEGKTLWLHLDGKLTQADRESGKRCLAQPEATETIP